MNIFERKGIGKQFSQFLTENEDGTKPQKFRKIATLFFKLFSLLENAQLINRTPATIF